MNELALFSGAGGGLLAAKLLRWRTVCAVELEPFRAERLCNRQNEGFLPPFPIWNGDIAAFDGRPWRGFVDVVSGGFPCQDISAANPFAEGITGARSGLWKEMRRVICEVGPSFVVVENSPMLTSRGLGTVLGDLAEMGFDAVWGVMGADDIGAFHRRDRIYILAFRPGVAQGDTDRTGLQGFSGHGEGNGGSDAAGHSPAAGVRPLADVHQERLGETRSPDCGRRTSRNNDVVANMHSEHRRAEHEQQIGQGERTREQFTGNSPTVENADSSVCNGRTKDPRRIETGRIAFRRGGPDCLWRDAELIECTDGKLRATKPGLCGMAHGMANRVDRVSAIGDGQVPAVVAAMVKILTNEFPQPVCCGD